MSRPVTRAVPQFLDPGLVHDVLHRAGFTDDGIPRALGMDDMPAVLGSDGKTLLGRCAGTSPLELLLRMFLLGLPVPDEQARRALAPAVVDAWIAAGILDARDELVAPLVRLLPVSGSVIASDMPALTSDLRADYVMGAGVSSLTLANLTVRRSFGTALDLGTGSGIQALAASPHGECVVAIDSNPRAIGFARFNVRLNGATNVRLVEGDWFGPVRKSSFDLVVSNPPFVIAPESRYLFRDSDVPGDGMCRRLVREAAASLREGGFAHILCNWAHVAGERWEDRIGGWCDGTGCDAWAMRTESQDPGSYATQWITGTDASVPERFGPELVRWLGFFEREGIESVGAGLITLRRTSGRKNWFRADESPERIVGPSGGHVLRGFLCRDFLESGTDVLSACMQIAPEVRLEQYRAPEPEGWRTMGSKLRLVRGLAYSGSVDEAVAETLVRCTGQRPLGEVLAEVTAGWDMGAGEITAAALPGIRTLVERGFLLPPGVT